MQLTQIEPTDALVAIYGCISSEIQSIQKQLTATKKEATITKADLSDLYKLLQHQVPPILAALRIQDLSLNNVKYQSHGVKEHSNNKFLLSNKHSNLPLVLEEIRHNCESLYSENERCKNQLRDKLVRVENLDAKQQSNLKLWLKAEKKCIKIATSMALSVPSIANIDECVPMNSDVSGQTCNDVSQRVNEILQQCLTHINEYTSKDVINYNTELLQLKEENNSLIMKNKAAIEALDTIEDSLLSHNAVLNKTLQILSSTPCLEVDSSLSKNDKLLLYLQEITEKGEFLFKNMAMLFREAKEALLFVKSLLDGVTGSNTEISNTSVVDISKSIFSVSEKLIRIFSRDDIISVIKEICVHYSPDVSVNRETQEYGDRMTNTEFSNQFCLGNALVNKQWSPSNHSLDRTVKDETKLYSLNPKIIKLHQEVESVATILRGMWEVSYFSIIELATLSTNNSIPTDEMCLIDNIEPLKSPYSQDTLIDILQSNINYIHNRLYWFSMGFKHCAVQVQKDINQLSVQISSILHSLSDTSTDELGISNTSIVQLQSALSVPSNRYFGDMALNSQDNSSTLAQPLWLDAINILYAVFDPIISTLKLHSNRNSKLEETVRQVISLVSRACSETLLSNCNIQKVIKTTECKPPLPLKDRACQYSGNITNDNINIILEELLSIVKSDTYVGSLESENRELKENIAILEDRLTALEHRMNSVPREDNVGKLREEIEKLTQERDTSDSTVSILRHELKILKKKQASFCSNTIGDALQTHTLNSSNAHVNGILKHREQGGQLFTPPKATKYRQVDTSIALNTHLNSDANSYKKMRSVPEIKSYVSPIKIIDEGPIIKSLRNSLLPYITRATSPQSECNAKQPEKLRIHSAHHRHSNPHSLNSNEKLLNCYINPGLKKQMDFST